MIRNKFAQISFQNPEKDDNKQKIKSRKSNKEKFTLIKQESKKTFQQFFLPDQLLLMGLQFYSGFNKSFESSDITRAYVSCVYGVSEVRKF